MKRPVLRITYQEQHISDRCWNKYKGTTAGQEGEILSVTRIQDLSMAAVGEHGEMASAA